MIVLTRNAMSLLGYHLEGQRTGVLRLAYQLIQYIALEKEYDIRIRGRTSPKYLLSLLW